MIVPPLSIRRIGARPAPYWSVVCWPARRPLPPGPPPNSAVRPPWRWPTGWVTGPPGRTGTRSRVTWW
ncbi:hypothetical protein [Solwaraspora sp. WMMA2080]|uniref:hypothetical protein n=1 Tax=unclassified Solwaraspora TaxID=2627926 RepID=UPI0032B120B6